MTDSASLCPLCDAELGDRPTMFQRIDSVLMEVHGRCEGGTRAGEDRSYYRGSEHIGDSRWRMIPR